MYLLEILFDNDIEYLWLKGLKMFIIVFGGVIILLIKFDWVLILGYLMGRFLLILGNDSDVVIKLVVIDLVLCCCCDILIFFG